MTITVFIPCWHPTPLNVLMKGRWVAAKRKKWDRQILWAHFRDKPQAMGKRSLKVTIVLGKGQRACDPDAYFKSLNDGLVKAKMLVDDNRQNLVQLPIEFNRNWGDWGPIITLMDVE